jgi:hypothetical protein
MICFCWTKKKIHVDHAPLAKQRSISVEAKMNKLIASVKDDDRAPFISICKHQGIIPDQMAQHLTRLLKTTDDLVLEKLHLTLCSQLKAERIQNIAERYRYNFQTYEQLEANCRDFSLDIRDVAEYFVQHCDDERGRQLRDAVLRRRDCPVC